MAWRNVFNKNYANCAIFKVSPRFLSIFIRVAKFGVVLKDSILATEDCGMSHIAASSRWL